MSDKTLRDAFEASVIERMKESGFLEVQIRVECLVRSGEDYQDELINFGWWAWQAAIRQQPSAADPDGGLCYVQDSRTYVGNCPLWWRAEGKGYTTNLDEAGRYTFDEAMRMHESRSTDIPWFCREIEPLRRATVDAQYLPRDTRDQGAAMLAAKEGGAA